MRVETTPIDGNLFNHDLSNWKTKVDQDYRPDWFDLDDAEKKVKEILPKIFKERFIVNVKEKVEVKTGRWYASGCSHVEAWDFSRVEAHGYSHIEAHGYSRVEVKENAVSISYESKIITVASDWELKKV